VPDDPLAEFRKTPPAPRGGPIPPKGTDEYVAFGTKDKVNRLRIRSVMAPVNSPGYHILLNVVYDGEYGTNFVLLYTVLMVLVRGKNLQKVVFAIENGQADFIQEFDPDKWQKPTDANAAIIESIEIKIIEGGSAVAGVENIGDKQEAAPSRPH
jgi:hypothetical protein